MKQIYKQCLLVFFLLPLVAFSQNVNQGYLDVGDKWVVVNYSTIFLATNIGHSTEIGSYEVVEKSYINDNRIKYTLKNIIKHNVRTYDFISNTYTTIDIGIPSFKEKTINIYEEGKKFYQESESVPYLDFTLLKEDKVPEYYDLYVQKIEHKQILGNTRKVFTVANPGEEEFFIYEGIGTINGLFDLQVGYVESRGFLHCYAKNDEWYQFKAMDVSDITGVENDCGAIFDWIQECEDTDNDEVCDVEDICPNLDNELLGTACDDEDPNTIEDTYQKDCTCRGIKVTSIQINVFLQGVFNGTTMKSEAANHSNIPKKCPYDESVAVDEIPNNAIDWVSVEIRHPDDSSEIIAEQVGFVDKDGQVLGTDGSIGIKFKELGLTEGFVAVTHRNHLGVMTANTVQF